MTTRSSDVADDGVDDHAVVGQAALRPGGDTDVELTREVVRRLGTAEVRRDDDRVGQVARTEVVGEHLGRVEVVDGDVEHAVHLRRVQRHRHDAVRAGGLEQLGDEPGADRDAGRILLVGARVREVRDHRGDLRRRRATGGIDHQQQLDEVLLNRRYERLDDEDVALAAVVTQLDLEAVVREPRGP